MASVLAPAMNHAAHPGLRSHLGANNKSFSRQHLSSSPQNSKRRCNLSFRPQASSKNGVPALSPSEIPKRDWFPSDFIFGAGTSAYQIEGAWNEDGKGPSVWDQFCDDFPGSIKDGSNAKVAVNSYHMYPEDVRLVKEMGMDAYRFSISWPRILPKGTIEGGINEKGIDYYNRLINLLLENGIEPHVTIFHWDTPQALVDKYGGFLDEKIVDHYKDFAELCFQRFGDRVNNWWTFNEPHIFSSFSYGTGVFAPGRCSKGLPQPCPVETGDSLWEPYKVGHNLLKAHAEAVDIYNKKYRRDNGRIGIVFDVMGREPYCKSSFLDQQARERAIDFNLGWFLEPVVRGDYPFSMRSLVGRTRLPFFTDKQQEKLVCSYDMLGLNYYTSAFSKHKDISENYSPQINTDDAYADELAYGPDGIPIGPHMGGRIYLYPEGLKDILRIMQNKYNNPPVYITENGMADIDTKENPLSKKDALNDYKRLDYIQRHIKAIKESRDLGANVQGYFNWSLLDNFEWNLGYTERYGIIYVDRDNNYTRELKESAKWLKMFNAEKKGAKKILTTV